MVAFLGAGFATSAVSSAQTTPSLIDARLPAGIDEVNASCLLYERLFRITLHRIEAHETVRDLFPAARGLGTVLAQRFPEISTATDGRGDELAGRYAATVEYLRSMPEREQNLWIDRLHDADEKPWNTLMLECPTALQWSRWLAHPERLVDPAWRMEATQKPGIPAATR